MVKKICITLPDDQESKLRTIQVRRMSQEKKTISFSSVVHEAITLGLERMA